MNREFDAHRGGEKKEGGFERVSGLVDVSSQTYGGGGGSGWVEEDEVERVDEVDGGRWKVDDGW